MKLILRDLIGKYYGTEIEVFDGDGNSAGHFLIWLVPNTLEDWRPSEREIAEARASLEMPDEPEDEVIAEWVSDSHYECAMTYKIAQRIVGCFNEESSTV